MPIALHIRRRVMPNSPSTPGAQHAPHTSQGSLSVECELLHLLYRLCRISCNTSWLWLRTTGCDGLTYFHIIIVINEEPKLSTGLCMYIPNIARHSWGGTSHNSSLANYVYAELYVQHGWLTSLWVQLHSAPIHLQTSHLPP